MEDNGSSSRMDVPFVEPKAPYIVSSGDAPFVLPLKATCVVSSICSLSLCTDMLPVSVAVCSLITCTVMSWQFRLMQVELVLVMNDVMRFLTCDKKFLIPVVTDYNNMATLGR